MDKDLLELVSALILQNEYYTERVKELQTSCKRLIDLNSVLSEKLNTLEKITINNQREINYLKSELTRLSPLYTTLVKNYSSDN